MLLIKVLKGSIEEHATVWGNKSSFYVNNSKIRCGYPFWNVIFYMKYLVLYIFWLERRFIMFLVFFKELKTLDGMSRWSSSTNETTGNWKEDRKLIEIFFFIIILIITITVLILALIDFFVLISHCFNKD